MSVSDVIQTQICQINVLSLFSFDAIILILNWASEVDLKIITTWFTNLAGNLFLSVYFKDDTCGNMNNMPKYREMKFLQSQRRIFSFSFRQNMNQEKVISLIH